MEITSRLRTDSWHQVFSFPESPMAQRSGTDADCGLDLPSHCAQQLVVLSIETTAAYSLGFRFLYSSFSSASTLDSQPHPEPPWRPTGPSELISWVLRHCNTKLTVYVAHMLPPHSILLGFLDLGDRSLRHVDPCLTLTPTHLKLPTPHFHPRRHSIIISTHLL